MSCLSKNVDHIKQIIAVQQSHAKTADVIEEIDIARLLEDAISVNTASLESNHIRIVRELADVPTFSGDKHAILQILINLLANAKHAVMGNPQDQRRITIHAEVLQENDACTVRISIRDNGIGITPENINKIFTYGFTTKKDGHGFGLHASANTAKKLKGSLSAHSDGTNRGAVFTLELPLSMEQVIA
jgi:C4-dicarboxylate-specific signal transduction histidine kinase